MKEKQNFQDNSKGNVELGKVKKDIKNDVSTKVTKDIFEEVTKIDNKVKKEILEDITNMSDAIRD